MGSDFSYSDVAGRQLYQDDHSFINETEEYFFIRSVPKDATDPYSRIDLVIKKNIYVPLQIIFYNRKGKKLKTLINNKIELYNNLYITIEAVMKNHLTGSSTLLQISDIILDHKIADNSFGVKTQSPPSRRWRDGYAAISRYEAKAILT